MRSVCVCVAYESAAKERKRGGYILVQGDILHLDKQQINGAKCKMCNVDCHLSNNDEHTYKTKQKKQNQTKDK
jgi:hypothetical protein